MRLIDADALPKYTGYALSADEVAMAVENAPTIEAEPVKHGRWIKDEDGVTVCSECEEVALQRLKVHFPDWVTTFDAVESNYCPHCGAKMDEVK